MPQITPLKGINQQAGNFNKLCEPDCETPYGAPVNDYIKKVAILYSLVG